MEQPIDKEINVPNPNTHQQFGSADNAINSDISFTVSFKKKLCIEIMILVLVSIITDRKFFH